MYLVIVLSNLQRSIEILLFNLIIFLPIIAFCCNTANSHVVSNTNNLSKLMHSTGQEAGNCQPKVRKIYKNQEKIERSFANVSLNFAN